jgi:hypothetical protein
MSKHIVPLVVAFACFVEGNAPTFAQSEPQTMIDEQSLPSRLADFLDKYTRGVLRYYRLYETVKKNIDHGLAPIDLATKIIAGEPINFDKQLFDDLNAQRVRYDKLADSLITPDFKPADDSTQSNLVSPDALKRHEAVDKIEQNFKAFDAQIKRFEEKRDEAMRRWSGADEAARILHLYAETVNEINNSTLGYILNAGTFNKFEWLWADAVTTMAAAIGGRAVAAANLVQAYNRALKQMKERSASYEDLRSWISFLHMQDRRDGVAASTDASNANMFAVIRRNEELARRNFETASSIKPPSTPTETLMNIERDVNQGNQKTLREVADLWKQAGREDEAARNQQRIMAIVGMALGAADLVKAGNGGASSVEGGAMQSVSGSVQYNTPNYEYRYQFTIVKPVRKD